MGILKQVPEVPLGGGAATGAEILLRLALVSGLGQQPPRDIMTLYVMTLCVMTS